MLRITTQRMISAKLVLATGSRAGTEAPLMCGYYMIGRDKDCQIRPKSRSVSRRHCLVHLTGHSVRILDLQSTSGTQVNGDRIAAKEWVDVEDGDTLKFGKIAFDLSTQEVAPLAKGSDEDGPNQPVGNGPAMEHTKPERDVRSGIKPNVPDPVDTPANATMVTGAAWDTFDVAGFLESADREDQEQRYEEIRSKHGKSNDATRHDEDELLDSDSFEASDAPSLSAASPSGKKKVVANGSRPNQPPRNLGKLKPTRSWSFRFPNPVDWFAGHVGVGGGKMALAVVMAIAVIGFAGWQIVQLASGPEVRVLQEIE